MGKFDDRVAVVTGAGRGIGRAIAIAFATEGAKVVVAARSTDELDTLVEEIKQAGGTARAVRSDLSEEPAPARLLEETQQTFGPTDILVNNAGLGSSADPRPFVAFDDTFWERSLQINLTAPYLLCKGVLPAMIEKGWGRIVNIASINSRTGSIHGVAYAASKHGLLGLTRSVALEVAAQGITVNAICPGPVKTAMNDIRVAYDAERLGVSLEEYEAQLTPIGGRLVPEDIASMAVYLASDDARMITGQAYNICGGRVMS